MSLFHKETKKMKHMKRFVALFAALALVLAMAVPAFADEGTGAAAPETGTITINNAVKDVTYKFYRIMDIATHTSKSPYTGVVYKTNDKWSSFVRDSQWSTYFTVKADGIIEVKPDTATSTTFAADFAKAAKEAIDSTHAEDYEATATTSTLTKTVPLGYYLVVPEGWADVNPVVCSLGTTNPNVTINEKNGSPTIDKEVREGDDFGKTNDAAIGDYVEFQLTINVVDGTPSNYVVHDTMSAGLTFVNEGTHALKVTRNDKELAASNYSVVNTSLAGGCTLEHSCTFEVKFNDGVLKTNDKVVITYWAKINENAVVGNAGNTNSAILKYGTNGTAQGGQTTTYVWGFDVKKYTNGSGNSEVPLAGAKFQVKSGDKVAFFKLDNTSNVYKFAGWDVTGETSLVSVVETPATGEIKFEGLDSGTYALEEVEAPKGYNKLDSAISFTIKGATAPSKGQVSYGTDGGTGIIKVLNKAGTTLPTTGGIGTTIFYLIGGGLMVAAAVLLIAKKRMENK